MKQLILAACLLLVGAPSLMAQSNKLGHIDRQALMLMLPERPDAEKKMQDFAKTLDDRLKAMGAEYQQKIADYQSRATIMTQTEKEVAQREITELEQRIQDAQEKAQDDLAKQEQELLKPMVARTDSAITAVAKEKGFSYIFDSSAGFVLYYDGGEDILPLVKAKLGL
ncbi:MAG: OmpH family outer membrane protein [Flavobacteriales bacterium]|nr:OmpH family outer membrane protein [Flavobacteriales bacterium]MCB9166724.1 OmpH family outer membrane protein [Flavobacteriales bacterium]